MVLEPSGNLGNLKGLENPQIDLGSPWGLEETLGRLWEPSWGLLHIGPLNRTFRCHWGHSDFVGSSGCLYLHSSKYPRKRFVYKI